MALEILNLIIKATDNASRTIGNVVNRMTGLGSAANAAAKQGGVTGDAIAFGMVKAQLAISAITSTVGKLEGALSGAADLELENLSAAAGLAGVMGGNIDNATASVNRLNAEMAKIAGPLPGATADYVNTARQITAITSQVFTDASGKLSNVKGFEKMTKELSTSYTAMAAAGMVGGLHGAAASFNMQLVLQRMLSGATKGELQPLNAYGQNPILKDQIEKYLKEKGVTELRELGSKAKIVQAVNEIGKRVATPEYLSAASKTVNGMVENLMSGLFDPNSGLFGLMRDLDSNPDNGLQTAFGSYEKFLAVLIGKDGITDQLGKLAETMGLSKDPMKILRDAFDWMAKFTKGLSSTIKVFRESISKQTPESAFKWLQDALGGLGGWIAEQYNRFITWLDKQVRDFDPSSIPTEQISGAILGFINGIADFFNKLDKAKTAQLGMDIIFKLIETIGYVLTHLDPEVYAAIAGVILARILPGLIALRLAGVVAKIGWLSIIPAILRSLLPTIYPAFAAIGARFAALILAATGAASLVTVGWVAVALAFIGYSLYGTISEHWEECVSSFSQTFARIKDALIGIWEVGLGIVTLNSPLLFDGLTKLFKSVTDLFHDLQNKISILTTGETLEGRAAREQDFVRQSQLAQQGYVYETNGDGNTALVQSKYMGHVPAAFGGHIPAAFGGLMTALSTESRNMPRGASLAVANTSEAILQPEQLRRLVFGSAAAGAAGAGMTFAPQITVNGSSDPRQTAEMVMAAMEQMFGEFTRGQLA